MPGSVQRILDAKVSASDMERAFEAVDALPPEDRSDIAARVVRLIHTSTKSVRELPPSIPEALAMLSALVIVPITLTISRGRRLTISRGRRLAVTRGRWGLAGPRHSQLTNSGYGDLSLSVGWR
jgi:hypothetical protein